MLEIKDHMDRGVQVTLSPDKHHLVLSGPDGIIRLDSFNVEALGRALAELDASGLMMSVPRLAASPLPAEPEAVFTPDNPRPEEKAPDPQP
jgi:hypothetical protein